jgi:hypothetical protein
MNPIYKLRENKDLFGVIAFLYPRGCIVLAIILIGLILLGILISASYVTTAAYGDDFLPPAEYLLHIEDEAGQPINGAILHTYIGDAETRVDRYPLEGYVIDYASNQSNADGVIIIDHLPKHMEMDSEAWALLWVFPIFKENKDYTGEITANGYKPLRFPLDQLIEVVVRNPFNRQTAKFTMNGDELKLPIYELRLTLQKQ